jgi:hypothetical protein
LFPNSFFFYLNTNDLIISFLRNAKGTHERIYLAYTKITTIITITKKLAAIFQDDRVALLMAGAVGEGEAEGVRAEIEEEEVEEIEEVEWERVEEAEEEGAGVGFVVTTADGPVTTEMP